MKRSQLFGKSGGRFRWMSIVLISVFAVLLTSLIVIFSTNAYLNSEEFLTSDRFSPPPDETPPVIVLNGDSVMTVAVGTKYEDPGYDAYDYRSDVEVELSGDVDTSTVGEYVVTYTVTDHSGNFATAERTVKVVQPTGVVYLTFDDGPGPYTAQLLDILAKYNVKVTFFVTGAGDDELIKREYDEGHAVALHTYSHDYAYVYSSVDNYFADLYSIQSRVKNITGYTSTLIRFPGGSSNLVSARYDGGSHIMSTLVTEVGNRGFTYFDWNISSGDAGGATTSDQVFENVAYALKEGGNSVVLQHDIKGFSVDAVERIIQYGLANGYIFAKLDATSFTAHHGVNN